jgi:hypothetical protein
MPVEIFCKKVNIIIELISAIRNKIQRITMAHKQLLAFFMLFSVYNIYSCSANPNEAKQFQQFLDHANNTKQYVTKNPGNTALKVGGGLYMFYEALNLQSVNNTNNKEINLYSLAFAAVGTGLWLWFAHDVQQDAQNAKPELPAEKQ